MDDTKRNRLLLSHLIAGMCANFGRQMDEVILAKYTSAMLHRSEADVRYAFNAIETRPSAEVQRKNWATVADLLAALDGRDGLTLSQRTDAAWTKVVEAIGRVGRYCGQVVFDDAAIHVAISRLGGWAALCRQNKADFDVWTRRAFHSAYAEALELKATNVPMLRGEPKHRCTTYVGNRDAALALAHTAGLAGFPISDDSAHAGNGPVRLAEIAGALPITEVSQ